MSSRRPVAAGRRRTFTFRPGCQSIRRWCCLIAIAGTILGSRAGAQAGREEAAAQSGREVIQDALDRQTPRGTVLGFLAAAREDNFELAGQYLDTRRRGTAAARLAEQLYTVIDARLETRLTMISEHPEGSRTNPLKPDQEVIGTIERRDGKVDVVVERVSRNGVPVWLFSGSTLAEVPGLYDDVLSNRSLLPPWFTRTRVGGAPVVEWLGALLLIAGLYVGLTFLNRLLTPLATLIVRRPGKSPERRVRSVLPPPLRIVLVAAFGRWLLWSGGFSLFVRQTWALGASLVAIAAVVWFILLLSRWTEVYVRHHVPSARTSAGIGLVRLIRRGCDVLVILGGFVAVLLRFGVDPTPALAGLGVGGIAVALAAQKTLENVIAGASLIFDQAVNVGDVLKMNDVVGTVDRIGLRSIRIRTLDRTIISVPNSVIAGASVETFSARDMFWFHPVIGLSYETTPEQLRSVLEGLRQLLREHRFVEPGGIRVRFVRFGPSSLELDVSAYLSVSGWEQFLEVQEDLLFAATEIVERAGSSIALQTKYIRTAGSGLESTDRARSGTAGSGARA